MNGSTVYIAQSIPSHATTVLNSPDKTKMTAPAIAAAMQVEFMASALGACRAGHGWMARCPAHSDRTPSLSIDIGENGKLLVFCHAGCTQTAVIAALRARGLWSGIAEVRTVPRKRKDGPAVPDKSHLTAIALRVWDTAKDATGSLGNDVPADTRPRASRIRCVAISCKPSSSFRCLSTGHDRAGDARHR